MEIIATSVHLIDYENGEIRTITPPEAFGEYVSGLIGDINSNTTVREFMTLSVRTEVINAILDTQSNLRDKLLELPDVRKFDRQFTPVPSVIKARIKREYDVYQGIKLQITDEIDKIEEVIYSERDEHGTQYLKIRTTDNVTFKRFFKRKEK